MAGCACVVLKGAGGVLGMESLLRGGYETDCERVGIVGWALAGKEVVVVVVALVACESVFTACLEQGLLGLDEFADEGSVFAAAAANCPSRASAGV